MQLLYSIASPARPFIRHAFQCLAAFLFFSQSALAYTLTCDLQGSFPELDKITLEPAQVKVDITSIGDHLYIRIDGPKLYNFSSTPSEPLSLKART